MTKNEKERTSRRVQLEMPPRSMERLEALKSKTEATSYAEVVRNALRLYEAMIEEVEEGHEVMIKRNGEIVPYRIFGA